MRSVLSIREYFLLLTIVRSTFLICCLVAFSAQLTSSARAFELFGICFSENCENDSDEEAFIDPKTYDVEFVDGASDDDGLSDAVRSASELWRGRGDPVAGSAGLISRAKGDYRRILAALYNEGYYGGSISILLNGQQAANIAPGTQLPEYSNLTVEVDPGPVYEFSTAEIINAAPFTDDPKDQVKSIDDTGFSSGEVARASAVRRAENNAVMAWRQQGHPFAKVADKRVTAQHPQQVLNVSIYVEPGPKAYFGPVSVSGTENMDPDFVAYIADLEPGKEYDPDDISKAKKRLDRLGVFSSRKVETSKEIGPDGQVPVNITVSERKLRRLGLGATASSVDGFGAEAFWMHRNLFGRAERFRVDAKLGGVGSSSDPEKFDYLLSATLTQPGRFSPNTDLNWNAFAKKEFNETFEEKSGGGSVAVTHYYSDEITYSVGAFGKYGDFDDEFGQRSFVTAGLESDVVYDTRSNKTDPTSGFYAQIKAQPFYEFRFENAAVRLETEFRAYRALTDDNRSVLAGRVKFGSLLGASIIETPPDLLFNAGGGNSVRGFAFKNIGVPGPNNNTTGGRSLFEGSVELRQRFTEQFGAVAFVDAGNVGADGFIDFEQELSVGIGAGIRYYTGLGPIRLDVAVPLNPNTDDPDVAFYAGIGQAF